MGLCVFFLIFGPAVALIYLPLTMLNQKFCLVSTDVWQSSAEPTPAAAKGLNAIRWTREADEHFRNLKRTAYGAISLVAVLFTFYEMALTLHPALQFPSFPKRKAKRGSYPMINNLTKLGMPGWTTRPPRTLARFFIVVGGLEVIGLILILAALGNPGSRASSSRSKVTGSVATAKESAAQVSATLLYDQYHANEVNADDYYRDRLVAVSGKVAGINKYFSDSTYIELETSNEFESVQAHLANGQAEKASALYKGAPVVVVCRGAGMSVGSPELRDCSIQ